MSALDSLRVDAALGGSYRAEVLADEPQGWWRLAEASGSVRDSSGNARHGTVGGTGTTTRVTTPVAEGGFAYSFNGSGYVTMGDVAALEFTSAFSIECWFKTSAVPANQILVSKSTTAGIGWFVAMPLGAVRFGAYTAGAVQVFQIDTTGTYADDEWHHVVCTWDGTTGANKVQIYIDGAVAKQGTASAGTPGTGTDPFLIGAVATTFALKFTGSIDEVAVYNAELSATRIAAHYAAAQWTDISEDVWNDPPLTWRRGIQGSGPVDRIAEPGEAGCELFNADVNSAGLEGYYSPGHENQRAGFDRGIRMRIVATFNGTEYPQFIGALELVDPEPGRNREHRVPLLINDFMRDLGEADLRTVALQINKTETELLQTIVENLPVAVQPLGIDFDTGLDTSPYAFHDLTPGIKAIQPAADVVISALGYLYVDAEGALRYENRQQRQVSDSVASFDNDMSELEVSSDLEETFTRFRLTVHPKRIDSAATTVLFSIPVASAAQPSTLSIEPGVTAEYTGEYFNPANVEQQIGGTAQPALVSGTDYVANASADGTGTNKTAAVNVTPAFYATSVTFEIENTDAAVVYMTTLQNKGKGLYDEAPVTVQAISEDETVERPCEIDLPYQGSPTFAQSLADYLLAQYEPGSRRLTSLTFRANLSDDFMLAALTLEVGDRITISEAVTGVTTVDVFVNGISVTVQPGLLLDVTLQVSPAIFTSEFWILEDADSELGVNTFLAFA